MYQEISGIMYQRVSERIRCRHISHNIIHISRRIEAVYQTLRYGFDIRNVIHVSRVNHMYRGISTYTCVKCVILRDTQFWYIFWTWWFFRVGSHGVSVGIWDPTRYHAPWDPTDFWYLSWYFSFWWILTLQLGPFKIIFLKKIYKACLLTGHFRHALGVPHRHSAPKQLAF